MKNAIDKIVVFPIEYSYRIFNLKPFNVILALIVFCLLAFLVCVEVFRNVSNVYALFQTMTS